MNRNLLYRRDFIAALAAGAAAGLCTPAALAAAGAKPVILVVGDSLSAEYGLARGTGWVALLEKQLAEEKIDATVVNASVSGDTTSGGRSRLPALLKQHRPSHVVIELGGNDALRGLPLQNTADNLKAMAQAARQSGAKVLIVGMQVPPNYGTDYAKRFAGTFASVAKDTQSALVPFLLKGVADVADPTALFQSDRIHPKAEAHPAMLANVWPELRKLLR
ncbi:arylesterase [Acidovorax sp. NCPPB 3576]|uniref:arylesterase n=1 Tax=Acidovorax sp. NCPPB 3576 TaxID=2940488 RepID=UPI00234B3789|nr:arylesterase [Acidovorax sp. NCPPB 3576]WCM90388.1 arylesterase [Acidovorax sp. NCPPB 3576]